MELVAFIGFLIGVAVGWGWRTYVFFRDGDCANPNHPRD